jgi:uncharacterized MAPEG superfamily protein
MAHYEFARDVVEALSNVPISRQRARRFARKAKKAKNPKTFTETAKLTDPELGEVAEKAAKQSNWKDALMIAAAVVTILAGAPSAIRTSQDAADWVIQNLDQQGSCEVNEDVEKKMHDPNECEAAEPDKGAAKDGDKPIPNATHPDAKT